MHVTVEGEAVVQMRFGLLVLDVAGVDLGVVERKPARDAILLGGEEVEEDVAGIVVLLSLVR